MIFLASLAYLVGPGLAGGLMLMFSGKCRGKNAREFFRLGGWGFLLTYLRFIPILAFGPLNFILMLTPSAICFLMAVNAIIREMRAQKNGEFTEAA